MITTDAPYKTKPLASDYMCKSDVSPQLGLLWAIASFASSWNAYNTHYPASNSVF